MVYLISILVLILIYLIFFRYAVPKRPKSIWFYEASFVFFSLFFITPYPYHIQKYLFVSGRKVTQSDMVDKELSHLICEKTGIQPHIIVLEIPELKSANILPGSKDYKIYVTRGLIEVLNKDQLAFVIFHEIVHHINHHYVWRMISWISIFIVFYVLSWLGVRILNKQVQLSHFFRLLILYGLCISLVLIPLFISKKHEYIADRQASIWIANSMTGIETLNALSNKEHGKTVFLEYLFSQHPTHEQRIKQLLKLSLSFE